MKKIENLLIKLNKEKIENLKNSITKNKKIYINDLYKLSDLKEELNLINKELAEFNISEIKKMREEKDNTYSYTLYKESGEKIPRHQEFGYRKIVEKLKQLRSGEYEKTLVKETKKLKEIDNLISSISTNKKYLNDLKERINILEIMLIDLKKINIERKNYRTLKTVINNI